jgi:hypothetical protein
MAWMPMSASGLSILLAKLPARTWRRAAGVALLAVGALASPAAAWNTSSYSISIVEGVTTLPEDPILHTSASAPEHVSATLRIVRNGGVVAQDTGEGGAWLSQVPQVGEAVTLESPSESGRIVGSTVYDGLPSMDPTVCAGSTNFSGQRSANTEVEGSYFTLVPHRTYVATRRHGAAQITSLIGSAFGGNFLHAPVIGETLSATEHETSIAEGLTFTYESETERPVGACPAPPPPPPLPPPPPALQGSLLHLSHITIGKLLRFGWSDRVTINQPGTVIQDLYLQGGNVPANASSAKDRHRHRKHKPAAVLLARGSASASSAGTVTVALKVTAKGRGRLKHARSVKATLVTTLYVSSGAKLTLERRVVTLHH